MLYIVKNVTGEVVATFTNRKAASDLASDLEIMTGSVYIITVQEHEVQS